MARALELELPVREKLPFPPPRAAAEILIHTGAGQPVRVWPLERYRNLVQRLRQENYTVQGGCDPDQRNWWLQAGEPQDQNPGTIAEMLAPVDKAGAFI